MLRRLRLVITVASLLAASAVSANEPIRCESVGQWHDPSTGSPLSSKALLERTADADFILLGERHDSAEHHRWQLHTLATLLGEGRLAAVGFEMLPRRKQAVLERWIGGHLGRNRFLDEVDWYSTWGYDPELYLPLFDFVRMHRIPGQALNVDRETVQAVRSEGWAALDPQQREGVGEPTPPAEAYAGQLAEVLRNHPGEIDLEHFIEAQTFWDRAMAEAMVAAHQVHGGTVVALVGRGHAEYGHGIPHQLAALGHETVVLLPLDADRPCLPGRADFVFALQPDNAESPPPKMGVMLRQDEQEGLLILDVRSDSPAETADLAAGDRILEAAGQPLRHPRELQQIVGQQPLGTWLPLVINRAGEQLERVVKFPLRANHSKPQSPDD